MNKFKERWHINSNFQVFIIIIVFSITGSASLYISRPFMKWVGVNKENLNTFFYWFLYVLISFIAYQILLVAIGTLFGQHKFFWSFEKKMLSRLGFKRILGEE